VDDLHHRTALVGAARGEVLDQVDVGSGRQRTVRFVCGCASEVVEAVGEHANLDAGSINAQSGLIQGLLHLCRGGAASADPDLCNTPAGPCAELARLAKVAGATADAGRSAETAVSNPPPFAGAAKFGLA
jgi:hypothetical protein